MNIGAVADPQATAAAQRPARFLRVEKAVSIPDEDIVDLDNTAFGPNIAQGMREIVAYAPIEPDGSVRVKVPARVALAVSVLDANGRRISARHQNWIQVMPGQELECHGCHAPSTNRSHGRVEAFDAAYAGASGTGVPFPNTRSMYSPDVGDTMAETRTRIEDVDSRYAARDAARVPAEALDRAEREPQLLRRVDQSRGARARRVVLVRLHGAHDARSGRHELHRNVVARIAGS